MNEARERVPDYLERCYQRPHLRLCAEAGLPVVPLSLEAMRRMAREADRFNQARRDERAAAVLARRAEYAAARHELIVRIVRLRRSASIDPPGSHLDDLLVQLRTLTVEDWHCRKDEDVTINWPRYYRGRP